MRHALIVLLLVACGSSATPISRIERTRVIAGRVHVVGDPTRAWLLPGESGVIDYLVVGPSGATDPLRTSFLACVEGDVGLDAVASCRGDVFDAASADVPSALDPIFARAFSIPVDLEIGLSTTVLTYLGTCIGDGASSIDVDDANASCTSGSRSELHALGVRVVSDRALANHNPDLHDEDVFLGDVRWTEPDPSVPLARCASLEATSSLPRVRLSGFDPTIIVGCSSDDREHYAAFDADLRPIVAHEHLDIAEYVTLGRVPDVTRIDDDVTENAIATTWTRPVLASDDSGDADLVLTDAQRADLTGGLVVRFWIVARDGRGGTDWLERDLCLVP